MGEFKGTKNEERQAAEKPTIGRREKQRERTSEREEAADRACAATVELRSQVLVHGRNGRVDRFPSIRARPHHARYPVDGAGVGELHGLVGMAATREEGEGKTCTARRATSSVRERPRGVSSSPPLLLSSLFSYTRILPGVTEICGRRSERAGNREPDKERARARARTGVYARVCACNCVRCVALQARVRSG